MDETELIRIGDEVALNSVRIYAAGEPIRAHDAIIGTISLESMDHSDNFERLNSEIQEIQVVLRGLKRLLDDADNGMYDTEQLLGDVKDLLYGV